MVAHAGRRKTPPWEERTGIGMQKWQSRIPGPCDEGMTGTLISVTVGR